MKQTKIFTLSLALWGAFSSLAPMANFAQQARPVRGGILFNISGMALIQHQSDTCSFLVVHDNKGVDQNRIARIDMTGNEPIQYSPLAWPTDIELPIDLEALTTVPQTQNTEFMAASSRGQIYHLSVNTPSDNLLNTAPIPPQNAPNNAQNLSVSVRQVFNIPDVPANSNFEGFALQQMNNLMSNQLLAVWAHRGADAEPAVLYWGLLDLNTYAITQIRSASVRTPWPTTSVRHISDLKIDPDGILYISAASDTGDDGPFESAVYIAGKFNAQGNQIFFEQDSALFPLYRLNYHKVEALEIVPGGAGGIFLGTDDENMGSSIFGQCYAPEPVAQ